MSQNAKWAAWQQLTKKSAEEPTNQTPIEPEQEIVDLDVSGLTTEEVDTLIEEVTEIITLPESEPTPVKKKGKVNV